MLTCSNMLCCAIHSFSSKLANLISLLKISYFAISVCHRFVTSRDSSNSNKYVFHSIANTDLLEYFTSFNKNIFPHWPLQHIIVAIDSDTIRTLLWTVQTPEGVANSRQVVVLQLGESDEGLTPHRKN
jgi:hypothetical protein